MTNLKTSLRQDPGAHSTRLVPPQHAITVEMKSAKGEVREFLDFALFWVIISIVPLSIYASWKIYDARFDLIIRVPYVAILVFVMSVSFAILAFFALAVASYIALRLEKKKDEQTRARPTSTIDYYLSVGSRLHQADVSRPVDQTTTQAVA
jgi:hypothetical protein